jgi:hypothetical protein
MGGAERAKGARPGFDVPVYLAPEAPALIACNLDCALTGPPWAVLACPGLEAERNPVVELREGLVDRAEC